MSFRRLALLLVPLFALPLAAHGQLAAYGLFSAQRFGGITCLEASCGTNSGSVSPIGGTGGLYYDFRNAGRFRLGVDVRATALKGNKLASSYFGSDYRAYSVLGGVRASLRTRIPLLNPYVQGSVGLGRNNGLGDGANYANRVQYMGFAGLDLRLLPVLDFRAVELGGGALSGAGTGPNSGTHSVLTISTGLVVHFPVI